MDCVVEDVRGVVVLDGGEDIVVAVGCWQLGQLKDKGGLVGQRWKCRIECKEWGRERKRRFISKPKPSPLTRNPVLTACLHLDSVI